MRSAWVAAGVLIGLTGGAAAQIGKRNDAQVIAEATAGQMKAAKGSYFDKGCNEKLQYAAEVVDLNGDGQPEVFTRVYGICLGGAAGVSVNLYVKDRNGRWKAQFGFPGDYMIQHTRSMGYPDIEIGGPGSCSPLWRWNGRQYRIFRRC
jgi:hypothetical protein